MDRHDLVEILTETQVDPKLFTVGGETHESLCLTFESGVWHVFLAERGNRYEEGLFETEAEACIYFMKRIFQLQKT